MATDPAVEHEASDQPPPTPDPFTRAQIISLVVPAVSLLLLILLLLWGTLSSVRPAPPRAGTPPATPAATPTRPAPPVDTTRPRRYASPASRRAWASI
ncbi:MAG TPA: hypothetical protein VKY74_07855 [Chloroflexia bacterium]|nr:hypothetical protein [Chloroflexia bacterium]